MSNKAMRLLKQFSFNIKFFTYKVVNIYLKFNKYPLNKEPLRIINIFNTKISIVKYESNKKIKLKSKKSLLNFFKML